MSNQSWPCFIYRSPKRDEMYLYISHKDCFDDVPEELLKTFGRPQFSMMVDLTKRESLARVSLQQVKNGLQERGYFLQMPPTHDQIRI